MPIARLAIRRIPERDCSEITISGSLGHIVAFRALRVADGSETPLLGMREDAPVGADSRFAVDEVRGEIRLRGNGMRSRRINDGRHAALEELAHRLEGLPAVADLALEMRRHHLEERIKPEAEHAPLDAGLLRQPIGERYAFFTLFHPAHSFPANEWIFKVSSRRILIQWYRYNHPLSNRSRSPIVGATCPGCPQSRKNSSTFCF